MANIENEKIVRDFIHSWEGGIEAMAQSIRDHMTPDCVWWNSGYPDCNGPEEAAQLILQVRDQMGVAVVQSEIIAMISDGDNVVAERRERLLDDKGALVWKMETLGVFQIKNGKFVSWRDYADGGEAQYNALNNDS